MKNVRKYGIIALIVIMGLAFAACEEPAGGGEDLDLSGTVTITPSEDVVIGTELTASYTGDEEVSYQWKKDGNVINGANSSAFIPEEVGTYTVTVSAQGYKSKTSAAVSVADSGKLNLEGTVTITPSVDVTTGTELTASYTGDEDVSYQWKKDGNVINGANSNIFTPEEAGSYTVTVSAEGYNSKSAAVNVFTDLTDLSGFLDITYSGYNVTGTLLTAIYYPSSGSISYQWKKDGINIAGANSNTFTPEEAGSYTVTISAEGYNSKTSGAVVIIRSPADSPFLFDMDTGTILGYKDDMPSELVIPGTIEEIAVTSIGEEAFLWVYGSTSLTSVTIPDSVTSIGASAFSDNSLTEVIIPDNVISIGEDAFIRNQLTSVTIGGSVETIGDYAFCLNDLTEVVIPDSVISIGASAFDRNQLTSVSIGSNVETLGNSAFSDNQLTEVTIPDSVTSIGNSAFSDNKLSSVTIGNSVETIGSSAFSDNDLTEVTIPDSVTSIGSWAFDEFGVTSVTIGANVTVAYGAFYSVFISAYDDCGKAKGTYKQTGSSTHGNVTHPIWGRVIGDFLYTGTAEYSLTGYLGSDKELILPSTINDIPVTSIGDNAFYGFQLVGVTIGSNVKTIGAGAFRYNQLTSIEIPDSVTTIESYAFCDNQLTSIRIGDDVSLTGYDPFDNGFKAAYVTYGGSDAGTYARGSVDSTEWLSGKVYGDFLYREAANNSSVRITGYIGSDQEITIPSTINGLSVTNIGSSAFEDNQMTSVTIPDSVTDIQVDAFQNNQLISITIGANVMLMYKSCFDNGFDDIYNDGGKLAGTYTRPSVDSAIWTKQP